jgi:hypothetical protein
MGVMMFLEACIQPSLLTVNALEMQGQSSQEDEVKG